MLQSFSSVWPDFVCFFPSSVYRCSKNYFVPWGAFKTFYLEMWHDDLLSVKVAPSTVRCYHLDLGIVSSVVYISCHQVYLIRCLGFHLFVPVQCIFWPEFCKRMSVIAIVYRSGYYQTVCFWVYAAASGKAAAAHWRRAGFPNPVPAVQLMRWTE